jgi:glycosyltransferase involved in cell wall biosynthesis
VDADGKGAALVLVFNTVDDDSRVLREARTLRDLGFDVVVAGVVSAEEQRTEVLLDGLRVVRLTPVESVRRLLRLDRPAGTASAEGDGAGASTVTARAGQPRLAPIRRLVIAIAYWLQGVALVRRVSPALVHVNDYNTMWVGIAAKLLRGSRLVYDAHEIWPDRYGRLEWRPWLVACEWLFVRAADATVTVSPGVAEVMARRYHVDPPVVVRNVPDRAIDSPDRPEGLRAGEPPLAVYVGLLAPGRGIEETIQALAAVPGLRLRVMGRTSDDYRRQLERLAAEAGVADRVEYRAPVEPAAVTETIAGADMGVTLIQPICLSNELSLPNKLFEYVAAGLPVLASDLPVLGAVVREEGLGEAVPATDVTAIARAMRNLAEPTRNAEARERVRRFAGQVTWEREQQVLESVYTPQADDRHG